MVELAPQLLVADVERLRASLGRTHDRDEGILVLIGRRHLRSNNSWMHNIGTLVKGRRAPAPCRSTRPTPDASAWRTAAPHASSPAGTLVAPVQLTDAVAPGVVSLPMGEGTTCPASPWRWRRHTPA